MKQLLSIFRRFHRKDEGNVTLEFVLVFPVFMFILISAIEMGVITVRQTLLERGVDMAMREVRIGTGGQFSHDQIRDMICEGALVFDNCEANLRLEMVPSDPRAYTPLPATVDCVHHDETGSNIVNTHRNFSLGMSNELVMVRACILYDPIFPTTGLALQRTTDGNGKSALVVVSAFTQEPR